MSRLVPLLVLLLAACASRSPAVQMRFADDADGSPVAGAADFPGC